MYGGSGGGSSEFSQKDKSKAKLSPGKIPVKGQSRCSFAAQVKVSKCTVCDKFHDLDDCPVLMMMM